MANGFAQLVSEEWVTFPGGELEGKRPRLLCPACRAALQREAVRGGVPSHLPHSPHQRSGPLCFQCYRTDLDRERALKTAGELDTASDARFQCQLPFEPVNRARLDMLKAERFAARAGACEGIGQYVDKRRHAQIEARHALQAIAAEMKARQLPPAAQAQAMASASHAAELQLPDAWLPYVVAAVRGGCRTWCPALAGPKPAARASFGSDRSDPSATGA
jgi:hypothetical protein